ncbi:MAG: hypothetical protein E7408_01660 [Ruminococcaceae bacterium]|nr:hypothetical protein [Oscillospiraceae bacterium]
MIFSNQFYSVELGEYGQLLSFKNKGKEMIAEGVAEMPLFTICLIEKGGKQHRLSSSDSVLSVVSHAVGIVMTFQKVGGYDLDVTVTARFPKEDAKTYWSLEWRNGTGLSVEWVDFPSIIVPYQLKGNGGDNVIFWPGTEGGLIEDLSLREKYKGTMYRETGYQTKNAWTGVYPNTVSMQFMAYYSEMDEKGLYVAAHDPHGNLKAIEPHGVEEGIRIEYRLFPGTEEEVYSMQYEMVVGAFCGDWYDAADIYRSWLDESGELPEKKLLDNEDLPEWYAESPVVLIYPVRGSKDTGDMEPNSMFPYMNGAKHVDALSEVLGCKVMALLMHWEGTAPWAPPKVWPPYGGEEEFKKYVDHLHAKGNLIGVYASGIGWTKESTLDPSYNERATREYEELHIEDIACRTAAGTIEQSQIIGSSIRYSVDVCTHNEQIKDIVSEEIGHICDIGCDYAQYFDQNLGGLGCLCYSDAHGHAPVPGKWMRDDMVALYKRLQSEIREKGSQMMLGCEEGAAEPFIEYLKFSDSRANSQFYYGKVVPAYGYLYHEYLNNFSGNQDGTYWALNTLDNPSNLAFRIASCFISGNMISLVLTHDGQISWGWGHIMDEEGVPDQKEIITLVKNLNDWRRSFGKPYLYSGRMQKPVKVLDAEVYELLRRDDTIIEYPAILHTNWEASDGTRAQIFVNFQKEEKSFRIAYDKACTLIVTPDGKETRKILPGEQITVAPLSAVMIAF